VLDWTIAAAVLWVMLPSMKTSSTGFEAASRCGAATAVDGLFCQNVRWWRM